LSNRAGSKACARLRPYFPKKVTAANKAMRYGNCKDQEKSR
jgi:hypothetical protein